MTKRSKRYFEAKRASKDFRAAIGIFYRVSPLERKLKRAGQLSRYNMRMLGIPF